MAHGCLNASHGNTALPFKTYNNNLLVRTKECVERELFTVIDLIQREISLLYNWHTCPYNLPSFGAETNPSMMNPTRKKFMSVVCPSSFVYRSDERVSSADAGSAAVSASAGGDAVAESE